MRWILPTSRSTSVASPDSFGNMPAKRAATSICRQCLHRISHSLPRRAFPLRFSRSVISVSNESGQHNDDAAKNLPRWAQTPAAMKAPFKSRPLNDNDEYPVNEDSKVLDDVYIQFLGQQGDQVLTEEIKWLAVTHKSFDHGRRGFNDRLVFLGRRIVSLQTSLALLEATPDPKRLELYPPQDAEPASDSALHNVENITPEAKSQILSEDRLADLAQRYGLHRVIRWKPRLTKDLIASGQPKVLAQTIYAIVGAIALQKGGEHAKRVTREKVLSPLGW